MPETIYSREQMTDDYRRMVVRLMTRQFLAELATAEIYGHSIELAPTWREKVRQARFCREEAEHSESAARLLEELGEDVGGLLASRKSGMSFFGLSETLTDWAEVVVFNFLADRAGTCQLHAYRDASYVPWAKTMQKILAEEEVHQAVGNAQLERLCRDPGEAAKAQQLLDSIMPIVVKRAFGRPDAEDNAFCLSHGLKACSAAEVQRRYFAEVQGLLESCGLRFPDLRGVAAS